MLDELVVIRELPLWQEVVERLGNVAISVGVLANADDSLERERGGGTELGVFLVEQGVQDGLHRLVELIAELGGGIADRDHGE